MISPADVNSNVRFGQTMDSVSVRRLNHTKVSMVRGGQGYSAIENARYSGRLWVWGLRNDGSPPPFLKPPHITHDNISHGSRMSVLA